MSSVAPSGASVETEYVSRLASRQAALAVQERTHVRVSRLRLLLVAAAILLLVIRGWAAWPLAAVLVVAFLVAVAVHIRVLEARDRARRAVAWYEDGLARLRYQWIGRGDAGERFRPADHPYADDLDLFGRGGLFELLATPRTRAGQERLAAWLLDQAPPEEARARQDAVRELAALPDLRETMAVAGEGVRVEAGALRQWATAPPALPRRWIAWPLAALAAVNLVFFGWYLTANAYGVLSLALMTALGLTAWALHRRVASVIHTVETPARDLGVLAGLLRVLESETFTSPALQRLAAAIGGRAHPASREIDRLERLVNRLAARQNMMFAIPAALMLWATQSALAIDGWRRRAGRHVPDWLDAVGDFEALAALATFAAEHPDYAFPEFQVGPAHVGATALAHPLLPASAVANDVALGDAAPALLVVSGSNMSGKSTFLRALGVNVVLAHAGGPVRATAFRLSPLAIGASIRVQDSLTDGRSRFFAEITRLKQIVDLAGRHRGALLFLLDEILGGTNSHDRALGAEAVLKGLARSGAVGLITTHDLALSRIADAMAPAAANVHFADEFDAGGLSFDYRLRPGPVRTSNALALMKSIGLAT